MKNLVSMKMSQAVVKYLKGNDATAPGKTKERGKVQNFRILLNFSYTR